MIGSEKQIKWAEEIKENFIKNIANLSESEVKEISDYPEDVDYGVFKKMVEMALSQEKASVWIKNYAYTDMDKKETADTFILFAEDTDDEDWESFKKCWDVKQLTEDLS